MKITKRQSSRSLRKIAISLMSIPQLVRLFANAKGKQNRELVCKAKRIMTSFQLQKFEALSLAYKAVM